MNGNQNGVVGPGRECVVGFKKKSKSNFGWSLGLPALALSKNCGII